MPDVPFETPWVPLKRLRDPLKTQVSPNALETPWSSLKRPRPSGTPWNPLELLETSMTSPEWPLIPLERHWVPLKPPSGPLKRPCDLLLPSENPWLFLDLLMALKSHETSFKRSRDPLELPWNLFRLCLWSPKHRFENPWNLLRYPWDPLIVPETPLKWRWDLRIPHWSHLRPTMVKSELVKIFSSSKTMTSLIRLPLFIIGSLFFIFCKYCG